MFINEVLIEKSDKERLVELLKEANAILKKYPYEIYNKASTVTVMSRAKTAVKEAENICRNLYLQD